MDPEEPKDRAAPDSSDVRHVYMVEGPERNDGIDLAELAVALWQRKWFIAGLSFAFALIGVAYALFAPPIYRVDVVLAPNRAEQGASVPAGLGGLTSLVGINLGSSTQLTESVATLRSRAFAEEFIRDKDLLPVLYSEEWDPENERWIDDDHPDIWDAVKFFTEDVLFVEEEDSTGLVTLAIEWRDPELAAVWLEDLVDRINERLRAGDMANSERRLEYLNAQLKKASLVELRQAISRLIENEIQIAMLAQADAEYAFKIIDPPRVPNEHTRPNRTLIVVLMTLFGAVSGAFLSLILQRPVRRDEDD